MYFFVKVLALVLLIQFSTAKQSLSGFGSVWYELSMYVHPQSPQDHLIIAIPAYALALTAIKQDFQGLKQGLAAGAVSMAVGFTMKATIPERIPFNQEQIDKGADPSYFPKTGSFPSGHTMFAFTPTIYVHRRYGLEYALPAYMGSALVGYLQVQDKKHYWWDVVAGAALSAGITYFFTDPIDVKGAKLSANVMPTFGGGMLNVSLAF